MRIDMNHSYIYLNQGESGQHTQHAAVRLTGYRRSPNQGLMPPGLRYVGPRGDFWVFERRPQHTFVGHLGKNFVLPMPWVLLIIEQDIVRAFARPSPIMRLEDPVFHLPLPGVKAGIMKFKPNGQHINRIVDTTLERFGSSNWEGDLAEGVVPEGWPEDPYPLLDYWRDTFTEAGPTAICEVPWKEAGTLAGFLDRIEWKEKSPLEVFKEAM